MNETQNTPELRFEGFTETWKQHKLRELARIRTGFPFKSKDFSDDGHYRVITNANIQDNVSDVNASLGNRIDIEDGQLLRDYGLDIGDILVTMDGTVGRTAKVADDQLILAQRVGRLSAYKDGEFLYQALNSGKFSKDMATLSHGGTIKHISLEEIGSFLFLLPDSSKEQHLVGCFFSDLDSFIAFQQRKYERLRNLKQALLQKMFPKPGEQVPELRFEGFTEPWEERKVADVANRFDNLRVPVTANLRVPGTTPYYGANGIQDYVDGFTHDGEFVLVAEDGANDVKKYPVRFVNGRIWVNNHAHVLQAKLEIADNKYLAYSISQVNIESLLVGGGRAKLNAEALMGIEFYLPTFAEQKAIGNFFAILDSLVILYQRKCERLRRLKQALLQKMFV